jgi:hypothetical protein
MKSTSLPILLLFFCLFQQQKINAQTIKLTPQVIASQGANFKNNDFEISYTIGELAAVSTISNTQANFTLTQGFHQPDKFSVVIGISEPEGLKAVSLFPNPASDQVFLAIEAVSASTLLADLFDATGRKVIPTRQLIQIPGSQQFEFSVDGLAAGTYLLMLSSENGSGQKSLRFTKGYN